MKTITALINKYKILIVMFSVLTICIIGIVISILPKEENQSTEDSIQISNEKDVKVHYTEEDDISGYNYIINPEALREQGLYIQHIQTIPDEINRVFKKDGYTGERLKITEVEKKGTKLFFKIVALSDNKTKQCEYSYRNGIFEIN